MDFILDLCGIIIPSAVVLYSLLFVRSVVEKHYSIYAVKDNRFAKESVVELKIKASERLLLLLDRMSFNNLVLRVVEPGLSVRELHKLLIESVNIEYNHNITQQLYVSKNSWRAIENVKGSTIGLINAVAMGLPSDDESFSLSKNLLDRQFEIDALVEDAKESLRGEIEIFIH